MAGIMPATKMNPWTVVLRLQRHRLPNIQLLLTVGVDNPPPLQLESCLPSNSVPCWIPSRLCMPILAFATWQMLVNLPYRLVNLLHKHTLETQYCSNPPFMTRVASGSWIGKKCQRLTTVARLLYYVSETFPLTCRYSYLLKCC